MSRPSKPRLPTALTLDQIAAYRREYEAEPRYRVAMNAATQSNLEDVAMNRRVVDDLDWHFSHEVPLGGITAQNNAGTCWIYAGLNWLRKFTMAKTKTESFHFSQNYLVFWDRLEKSNAFLHRVIATRNRSLDDREVHHILSKPVADGGDWLQLSDLIQKYGLIPQTAMNDTVSLANSSLMNDVLFRMLRKAAARIRKMHAAGEKLSILRSYAREVLGEVHRVLCVLFGEPPSHVDVAYRCKDGKFRRHRNLTPHQVFKKFVGVRTSDYVHLVSSPLPETPYYRMLSLPGLRHLEGAPLEGSLNVPIETVRELAVKVLKKGEAVLFDCDVTEGMNRKAGVFDTELYDYELLFDVDLRWDRAERMAHLQQRPTHCMVFVGVDLVAGKPAKWRVENSWGEDMGKKGIFQMSDAWFSEHVYGMTVHKRLLGKKLTALTEKPSIKLPAWHTLG